MTNPDVKIGFIGVGNMASAIIQGITGVGNVPYGNLHLYDIVTDKLDLFVNEGANKSNSIAELSQKCDFVFLAVKPQNFKDVLTELKGTADSKTVYVSIAAGIETSRIEKSLGGQIPVIRALPNTPMLIGHGVSAICRNEFVCDDDYDTVCEFFKSAGDVIKIDESEMNRIISVTSSSPAYVFKFIKAICDGATDQDLDGNALQDAVCNMVIGAAKMLLQSKKTPDELISMVCSKGGTTERAVSELDSYSFEEGIISAMKKCTARADELSKL